MGIRANQLLLHSIRRVSQSGDCSIDFARLCQKRGASFREPPVHSVLPSPKDLLEIHFSVRGPEGTPYEGGIYHGRIALSPEHPFKAPNVRMLTKSGRFETGTNICYSYTSYHPEMWSPAIKFREIVIGLQSLFHEQKEVGIGIIQAPNMAEVEQLRGESLKYKCPQCTACHCTDFQQ